MMVVAGGTLWQLSPPLPPQAEIPATTATAMPTPRAAGAAQQTGAEEPAGGLFHYFNPLINVCNVVAENMERRQRGV